MTFADAPLADDEAEIAALIALLHQTEKRLEILTGGEVDAVADPEGRMILLHHAQERLRRSGAVKQSAILDALPAHIALLDWQGVVVSVNAPWREYAAANGFPSEDCGVGRSYLDVCTPSGEAATSECNPVGEGVRAVLDGRLDRYSLEYPCHSPTEQRWFRMTATPLIKGSAGGAVVMHLDITEKILGLQALRRFSVAINATSDAITLSSRKTMQYVEFNAAARRMLGYTNAEIFALGPAGVSGTAPGDLEAEFDAIIARSNRNELHDDTDYSVPDALHEYAVTRKDGTRFDVEVRRNAQKFDDDWILVSVARDITERKRAERRLLESERRFSEMLGNVELLSVMLDRSARITYCNPCLLQISGWRSEEIMGCDWFELFIPPEMRGLKFTRFPQILENLREAMHDENEIVLRSGERRLIRWNRSLLRSDAGEVIGIASIGEDITEQKRAERRIAYLNRVRAVLGSINALIVRVHDREALFDGACRIAVSEAGFRMAVLGIVSHDESRIVPVASAGADQVIEDAIASLLSSGEVNSQTMVARALRTRQIVFSNDSEGDSQVLNGPRYAQYGVLSMAMLPLVVNDNAVGVFGLYGGDKEFFRKEELGVLAELAGNIAFAIGNIDRQKKHDRLARTRAFSSEINTAIVHVKDRVSLTRETCRIAVETGGYHLAWIGFADREAMKIVPFAVAGDEPDLLANFTDRFSLDESLPAGSNLCALAVRGKIPVVRNDIRGDPAVLYNEERVARGIRSVAVLPLIVGSESSGVLTLYSDEIDFFDDEELALLTEVAGNIAFALDHLQQGERLNYLAYYDPLTGLGNRVLFLERLAKAMARAHAGEYRMAMCIIDVERFKNINDSLGRLAGDTLLQQVARWLTANSGGASLIGRLDADHFAALVPEVTSNAGLLHLLANAADAFLHHPFHLNDAVFRIAAKVGAAIFPDDGSDVDTLFKHAELAVKKAKTSGERFLLYSPKMSETQAGRPALENQLRHALENEEFVLHYQPKVNIASGLICGVEALLRWNDPRTGLVPPARFIPVLEETGLILEVGRWVLRRAIDEYLGWRERGLAAVPIAVNVSSLQLRDPDFFDEIRDRIHRDPRVATGLELEITESLMMEDVKQSTASLAALRTMGVQVAMDDFGTGFSSLGYLFKLPIDTLKIDRSFISEMTGSVAGEALVSTTINLAHSMGLCVVAEGVETEAQLQHLRTLGCDAMQGYLFCKPIPVDQLEQRYLQPTADALVPPVQS